MNTRVALTYYSDLLCVWAYVAEVRLDELRRSFPDDVAIDYRFLPVFGSTGERVGRRWSDRDGYAGYAEHVREVVGRFGHVELHGDVWTRNIPTGSFGAHAFVKAVMGLAEDGTIDAEPQEEHGGRTLVEELAWQMRLAFFRDLEDISRLDVRLAVAEHLGLPTEGILERLDDGSAWAALAEDHEAAARLNVTGSPTFVLNEGRQILYGNVGYRIVEANIQELLRDDADRASWC